ncbi:hypothetical protein MTR_4g088065 [Medicago truncatula]|uniref:Homeobox domain-containing protein n=1 Tax=Medicago truncatula TaxID=3880 RepID=A0A072UYM1_MEDTR|nr:hypothetical protein MTR_4g088065 [Medicago truncatula]
MVWRQFLNRLPTKYNLSLRGVRLNSSLYCVGGCGRLETVNHILFNRAVLWSIWSESLKWLGVLAVFVEGGFERLILFKGLVAGGKTVCERLGVILVSIISSIWNARNAKEASGSGVGLISCKECGILNVDLDWRICQICFGLIDVEPAENKVKKIHEQLQGFGQVGAVNVSYWFQNRNSRSKQKKRILYNKKLKTQQNSTPCNSLPQILTPPPNSFSSDHQKASIGFSNINDVCEPKPPRSQGNTTKSI